MELPKYKASWIPILVSFFNIIVALSEPSFKFVGLEIILTLASIKVRVEKKFLSLRIMCIVALSTKHISLLFLEIDVSILKSISFHAKKCLHHIYCSQNHERNEYMVIEDTKNS